MASLGALSRPEGFYCCAVAFLWQPSRLASFVRLVEVQGVCLVGCRQQEEPAPGRRAGKSKLDVEVLCELGHKVIAFPR
eukprot:5329251-Pyramimonas_sp.AAC.2